MPIERTIKLYQFDELDEKAKERARDWYRSVGGNTDDEYWYEHIYEDFEQVCKCLGVELDTHSVRLMGGGTRRKPDISWSGFSSQGDGACFNGVYRTDLSAGDAIRKHAPLDTDLHNIADKLVDLSSAYPEGVFVRVKSHGNYSHARTMRVERAEANEVLDGATGEWSEPELTNEDEFLECLRDLADWLYSSLEKAYEWADADEQIDESIRANEYTFLECGTRHD